MTSGEYLKQLEKYLRKLPQSDYEDAMEYFTEYFADAGPENEQAVIKELGTPKQAAAELMRSNKEFREIYEYYKKCVRNLLKVRQVMIALSRRLIRVFFTM